VYAAKPAPRRLRLVALLGGAAVVVGGAAAIALGAMNGSSTPEPAAKTPRASVRQPSKQAQARGPHKAAHHASTTAAVSSTSAAETNVAVLNATESEGLAHRTASALQQNGFSQATALSGHPPGSGQVSVVEYVSGHQSEAEGVAHSLSITHVLPIEAGVTALAGSADVVVIVGADRAG